MNTENIKKAIALVLDRIGITTNKLKKSLATYPNAIRAINYHRTPEEEMVTFRKQISFFETIYKNTTLDDLNSLFQGQSLGQQRILISFDDGLMNNYEQAAPILEKHGFTGYFFVSVGKIGQPGYMGWDELRDLQKRGHIVGCHTYSHHRMNINDSLEILNKEIVTSGNILQENLPIPKKIFCWCGGEEDTYTKDASKLIQENYDYSFMTNSELITSETDVYHLQRTNIEARWDLAMVRFQLCGFMDSLYRKKRERVNEFTQ